MKTIKIVKLNLKNFKGITDLEVFINAEDFNIFGANATGKTTIVDSFVWLLFGKDSQNKADFEIKTLNPDGTNKNNLEHQVSAELLIDDQPVNLCRMYKEKWTRKKGAATKEFTGHETKYWVDNVPVNKTNYQKKINEFINEDLFKILTDPKYFNEVLHWEKKRETLFNICGDIPDEEIIKGNKDLEPLFDFIKDKSLDDFRLMVKSQKKEANKELKTIPVRIDEASQAIPDLSGVSEKENLLSQIKKLQEKKEGVRQELFNYNKSGQLAELEKKKSELSAQRVKKEANIKSEIYQEAESLEYKKNQKREELRNIQEEQNHLVDEKRRKEYRVKSISADMEKLRDRWQERSSSQFKGEEICPNCGQEIPKEDLEVLEKKFNEIKASALESINKEGFELKKEKEGIEKGINKFSKKISELENQIIKIDAEIEKLQTTIDSVRERAASLRVEKDADELAVEEKIEAEGQEDNGFKVFKEQKEKEVDEIEEKIKDKRALLVKIEKAEESQKRVEELETKEKEMIELYEDLEYKENLTDLFIRNKVDLVEGNINSFFNKAKFKLFKENINGGIEPTCFMTYKGVPYTSLNNAGRINLGIDIINTFSKFYEISAPVFIDNAEAVNVFDKINAQSIFLKVTDDEKLEMGKLSV